jgi:hypothetical protein
MKGWEGFGERESFQTFGFKSNELCESLIQLLISQQPKAPFLKLRVSRLGKAAGREQGPLS